MRQGQAPIRILLIEDNSDDARLLRETLADARSAYTLVHETTLEAGLRRLEGKQFDVVLMDLSLPDSVGIDNVTRAHALKPQVPIVVLTGFDEEALVTKAMQCGAQDYLVKHRFESDLFERCIRHAIERHRSAEALRSSEERYALAVRGTHDGIWDWNIAENTIYLSPRWAEMLGLKDSDLTSNPDEWFNRLHPEDLDTVRLAFRSHLGGFTQKFETEYRISHANGTYRWMLSRAVAVRDASGKVTRMVGAQTDITEKTVRDPLTGLPNRVLLLDRLERAVNRARRKGGYTFAALVADVDRFKLVNATFGQALADKLLIEVARRIEGCLRINDTVARPGEDEFILLLEDLSVPDHATRVARRIHEALASPIQLQDQEIYVSVSIGIALSVTGYERAEDALRDANIAMARAKALGKGQYQVFDPAMHERAVEVLRLETELRRALERGEFRLHYQPIVVLDTEEVLGFEALLRWEHPEWGLVGPNRFVPVLEDSGLIVPVGHWVIQEACARMHEWQKRLLGRRSLSMSVNLSSRQFLDPDLIQKIDHALQSTEVDPSRLSFEITERLIVEHSASVTGMFSELRNRRIRIAIDDFGVGYSSLSYLHQFPLDVLKIDRSFTQRLGNGANSIVRTILDLASNLKMEVIAEGVETKEQLDTLKGLKCRLAQGYLFSRPVAAEGVEAILLRKQPLRSTT